MITDANESLSSTLEAEIAIAGAGPAGIVLALELARIGRRVLLIEGGGLDAPGDGASIYDNTTSGRSYPLTGSRLRWLGGTSNHWGGWVRPFDERDFEGDPSDELPGWPFKAKELQPWYQRAADWCEVGSSEYAPDAINLEPRARLLDLSGSPFRHGLFRFSPPTRFGTRYRDELAANDNIDCFVNLNLVELEQSDSTVRSAKAITLNGQVCRIQARHFVIAMGGVENARFLLNQREVPGNQADLVGRCFMDHFGFTPGLMLTDAGLQYERSQVEGHDVMAVIAPEAGTQGPNSCLTISPTSPDDLLPSAFWRNPMAGSAEGGQYRITMINAPKPHPASRITLHQERDAIGLRRAHLHWHLPPEDFEPVIALFRHWMDVVSTDNLARVKWVRKEAPGQSDHVGVGYHHMGTTRMSVEPSYGVVDTDGKLWDRDNLYMAGSSVFPSVGFSNPTLTIVALASRMAEHLNQKLGGS